MCPSGLPSGANDLTFHANPYFCVMAFSARFVAHTILFASQQGVDPAELVPLTNYTMDELCDPELTVSDDVYNAVIEAAVEQSGNPHFGLHESEYLNLSAAGLILQIVQSSRTVHEALNYCCEFANLGCSALPMSMEEKGDEVIVSMIPQQLWAEKSPVAMQQTADGVIGFSLREFRTLTRQKRDPIAVEFPWPCPTDPVEYERVYDCPVHFNRTQLAVRFKREHVEEQVVSSDYSLLQVLVQHAQTKLETLERESGFINRVKRSVINLVKPEFPSIEQVASNLNVSVRTLQRKLSDEGFTFKELMEDLKQQFAESYLRKPELSISEIAYLLNYADPSAFTRSFKRWTGKSPQAWRESQSA